MDFAFDDSISSVLLCRSLNDNISATIVGFPVLRGLLLLLISCCSAAPHPVTKTISYRVIDLLIGGLGIKLSASTLSASQSQQHRCCQMIMVLNHAIPLNDLPLPCH